MEYLSVMIVLMINFLSRPFLINSDKMNMCLDKVIFVLSSLPGNINALFIFRLKIYKCPALDSFR